MPRFMEEWFPPLSVKKRCRVGGWGLWMSAHIAAMFGRKRHREDRRYYLLPGMGRSNKRQRRRLHLAAVLFGVFISLVFGLVLYWLQR